MNLFFPLLILAGGLFTITCSIKDYDWFMNNYRARPLVRILGRSLTRLFYGTLGIVLTVAGIVLLLRPELMAGS